MKRGKDDDKGMRPMFPRLHVNDTEKGGPRAPPRNKMALYEQLSIPSQRYKPGMVPINSNNSANEVSPASSSQVSGQQRGMYYSHQVPPSGQVAEKLDTKYFDSSAPLMPLEQQKKSEEDDFRVPIFLHSNMGQDCGKTHNNIDRGELFPSSLAYTEHSSKHLTISDNEPRQIVAIDPNIRQEGRSQNEENLKELVGREQSTKAVSNSSSVNKAGVARQADTCFHHELRDNTVNNCSSVLKADHHLPPEHRTKSHPESRLLGDTVLNEPIRGLDSGNYSVSMYDFHSEEQRILDDTESRKDKTCRSLPKGNADGDDDASETSMVDSIPGLEISPDDVVGIIGQKHFWKARRAIVNQQRVFAIQVFELHRLIKVQKLIAGSPHLLLEDSAYLGKPIKGSSPKKLRIEYIVRGIPNTSKQNNGSEKPNHKIECSAENTVGKASLSSVQNNNQLPSYRPVSANSPAPAANGDHSSGSWCSHQPQGHQWLIPVMSPSEGLVYKPYPGTGFVAPAFGGWGPPGSTPVIGNFMTPAYGIPASHHYQGMGVPPFADPAGPQGYFPPYGMAVLNQGITGSAGDQMNHFAASGLHGQSPQLMPNYNMQHQNSSNVPSQRSGAIPDVMKLHASRDSELQISTASSPSERVQGNGRGNTTEGNNVLPLFPTSPVVEASSSHTQPQEIDHPARVIKVLPHNGILATESVARIFQSIQEERKQYDSV